MKKVLFVSNVPVPYRMEFFRELAKKTDLTVCFEADGSKFRYNYDFNSTGFNLFFLKKQDSNRKDWKNFFSKLNEKYDYIVLSGIANMISIVAIIYLKCKRVPFYIEIDGAIEREDTWLKRHLKTFFISSAVGCFSTGLDGDRYMIKYGAKEKDIYRYPFTSLKGTDILTEVISDENKNEIKKELGFSGDKPIILAVGRFIHRKGFDILLYAFKGLDCKAELVIIGGNRDENYENIICENEIHNVFFREFMTSEELGKYYQMADIFVLPTREEVWGLVINEALAHGCPVITTDNCVAGKELVVDGENGYIVPVEDVEQLNNKMNQLLEDRSLRQIMAQNNLIKSGDYTIEKMVSAHMLVFESNKN